jgi:hypothetical protein
MSARLADHPWQSKYSSDAGSLVTQFYQPALACALRYDRTSGYFTAGSLTLAARGVEHLSRNHGAMRLRRERMHTRRRPGSVPPLSHIQKLVRSGGSSDRWTRAA